MKSSSEEQNPVLQSKPLQNIKSIEQSLNILRHKLSQLNKRQAQNALEIQKVFYSSIPNLKCKLYRTIECEKANQKKKMLFNDNVRRQKKKINFQRKIINEKEIQRSKQLMNMMKIDDHNLVKQMSRKNQILIEKMKNNRIQQNKRKKQIVKGNLEQSRHKIQDFHATKIEEIRRQKEQDEKIMRKKMSKMETELEMLGNKENETWQRVDKSEQSLRQLRYAVDRMHKMNEKDFMSLKKRISEEIPYITEEKLIEKMLLAIVESEKGFQKTTFHTRKIYHSKWSSEHLSNMNKS